MPKTKKKSKLSSAMGMEEGPINESGAFSFDSLGDVHSEIQSESPDPNLAAIEATAAETVVDINVPGAASDNKATGQTDSKGTRFDPNLHAVNADGEPSVTPTGKFRKRRGASKVSVTNAQLIEQQKTEQQKQASRAAGQLAADMLVGTATTLLGPEWVPIGADGKQAAAADYNEHANLRRAFADYFETKGIADFPPGIALSIAVSGYMLPRIAAGPETKTRLAKAKIWVFEKWNNVKRKKKDAAQSDSRNDGERKNDAGEEVVQDEQPATARYPRT